MVVEDTVIEEVMLSISFSAFCNIIRIIYITLALNQTENTL